MKNELLSKSEELKDERSVKGLLLEIRNSDNYELKVIAEETLINKFTDLETELDRVKRLLDEAVKVCESIIKNQYGAQGYVEEEDWKGLSSYWASIVISYQDQARSLIQKLKGGE